MKKLCFASDYACPAHPQVIEAVTASYAKYPGGSYGEDEVTQQAVAALQSYFRGAYVLFTSTGTAANRLALQTLLGPTCNAVVCAESAHINHAECGALESAGYKILTVFSSCGKVRVPDLENLVKKHTDVHLVRPAVLSISNATEYGTVYDLEELVKLGNSAKNLGLRVHLDGARLFHAVASKKIPMEEMASVLGVEVITIGASKNGGIIANAVLFGDSKLAETARRLHKQQGQLCSRTHVLAAEFTALCTNNKALQLARHANLMAKKLEAVCAKADYVSPFRVESDALFLWLPNDLVRRLKNHVEFYEWDYEKDSTLIRLMCSWCTTEEDIHRFRELL